MNALTDGINAQGFKPSNVNVPGTTEHSPTALSILPQHVRPFAHHLHTDCRCPSAPPPLRRQRLSKRIAKPTGCLFGASVPVPNFRFIRCSTSIHMLKTLKLSDSPLSKPLPHLCSHCFTPDPRNLIYSSLHPHRHAQPAASICIGSHRVAPFRPAMD